ncbi:hypothetical protein [Paenibacillus massiliensis]|uniref:hypothetical protein n=1 Tax=Paenibacillus massiliensis TaxID=225917 RepID=UPI000470D895|nr:hypothetical protein [Paenibacillus massiliensis]
MRKFKEVTKEVIKEVTKEVIKEVNEDVIKHINKILIGFASKRVKRRSCGLGASAEFRAPMRIHSRY